MPLFHGVHSQLDIRKGVRGQGITQDHGVVVGIDQAGCQRIGVGAVKEIPFAEIGRVRIAAGDAQAAAVIRIISLMAIHCSLVDRFCFFQTCIDALCVAPQPVQAATVWCLAAI